MATRIEPAPRGLTHAATPRRPVGDGVRGQVPGGLAPCL